MFISVFGFFRRKKKKKKKRGGGAKDLSELSTIASWMPAGNPNHGTNKYGFRGCMKESI